MSKIILSQTEQADCVCDVLINIDNQHLHFVGMGYSFIAKTIKIRPNPVIYPLPSEEARAKLGMNVQHRHGAPNKTVEAAAQASSLEAL